MKASIIIRTYNEARHLPALLDGIAGQQTQGIETETILVDSGSTDDTVSIAESTGARIEHIAKADFSFGRSLNVGCRAASGDALVIISGHCIPASEHWLAKLLAPLGKDDIVWTYGRQIGGEDTRFSESQVFAKYFPEQSQLPQDGFFCNNANSALLTRVWREHPFDEELTGLEDLHLARKLTALGMKLGYVAEAPVYHLHHERWGKIKNRFEREAIALQHIMPEVHVSLLDFLRYFASSVVLDAKVAAQRGQLAAQLRDITSYRLAQYWGGYCGNHFHRKLSRERKERYFYPR